MLAQTAGMYNFVWWFLACGALWLLKEILGVLKALHVIELARFKRERPEVFED